MRKILFSAAVATVFAGSLVATLQSHSAWGQNAASSNGPSEAVQQNWTSVAAGMRRFDVVQSFGEWQIRCRRGVNAAGGLSSQPNGAGSAAAALPMPRITGPACRAAAVLHVNNDPQQMVQVTWQIPAKNAGFDVRVGFPPDYTQAANEGMTLRIGTKDLKLDTMGCRPEVCNAAEPVPPARVKELESAKTAVLVLPDQPKSVELSIPVDGLSLALESLRKLAS
jgi:hypothetical protein